MMDDRLTGKHPDPSAARGPASRTKLKRADPGHDDPVCPVLQTHLTVGPPVVTDNRNLDHKYLEAETWN